MENFILFVFFTVNAVLALAIFYNNPKSWTNRLFSLLISVLTFYLVANTKLYSVGSLENQLFLSRLIISVGAIINLVVFLFLKTFPQKEIALPRPVLIALVVVTASLYGAGFTPLIFESVSIQNGAVVPQPGILMPIFLIHTVGLVVGGIISLLLRFRKSTGFERLRIKFVLISFSLLFFFIIIFNFVLTVFFKFGNFVPLLPIYIIFFNILIGYSIIRHRLLDIRRLIARTVTYTLSLFIIAFMYVSFVFILTDYLPFEIDRTISQIGVLVLTIFTFGPIKTILSRITNTVFFKASYDSQELLGKLTQTMAQEIRISHLSESLLQLLISQVQVTHAAFVIVDRNAVESVYSVGLNTDDHFYDAKLWNLLSDSGNTTLIYDDLEAGEIKDELKKANVSLSILLDVKTRRIGLLLLGPKASGDVFTNQDIELLELLAPQVAVALQNAQSYLRIQQFSRTLEKKVEERTQELKETQAKALRKARELLKIKDEFVFIATHDLGTPVTAIKGYGNLLKQSKERFSSDTRENIDAIIDASERLNQLTNDLLQVARSDAGTIKIKPVELDVIEIIEDAIAQVTPRAAERQIKIIFAKSNKKILVLADQQKLAEVMENLLSNAVKYNFDRGNVKVGVKKKNTKEIEITVADSGIGIPAEMQHKVFTKFFRAQVNGAESVPGTGLGLFVVRMLIEKMGGKVEFSSVENKGTTFVITLPIAS